jgi:hypothetical protein
MIVKMAMLMAISVGTMIRMRWTMYPNISGSTPFVSVQTLPIYY